MVLYIYTLCGFVAPNPVPKNRPDPLQDLVKVPLAAGWFGGSPVTY